MHPRVAYRVVAPSPGRHNTVTWRHRRMRCRVPMDWTCHTS